METKNNNKEFIKKYALQYSLPLEETKALRKILKETFRNHGIEWREEKSVNAGNLQYYDTYIWGYTTGFAAAYAHIGLLYAQNVLPIWNARHRQPVKPTAKWIDTENSNQRPKSGQKIIVEDHVGFN